MAAFKKASFNISNFCNFHITEPISKPLHQNKWFAKHFAHNTYTAYIAFTFKSGGGFATAPKLTCSHHENMPI